MLFDTRGPPPTKPDARDARPEKRCMVKDADKNYAFEHCAKACGYCGKACVDSSTWHKKGDPSRDCSWVKRVFNRCAALDDDEVPGYEACRRSCHTCDYDTCA